MKCLRCCCSASSFWPSSSLFKALRATLTASKRPRQARAARALELQAALGAHFRPPLRIRRQPVGEHQPAQIMQSADVDPALEIHDLSHRSPIVGPSPPIELGLVGAIETQLCFGGRKLQEKPALLLADAAVPYILPGQSIAQPPACRTQKLDIIAFQTRPGTAKGTSSRQKRCHPVWPNTADASRKS